MLPVWPRNSFIEQSKLHALENCAVHAGNISNVSRDTPGVSEKTVRYFFPYNARNSRIASRSLSGKVVIRQSEMAGILDAFYSVGGGRMTENDNDEKTNNQTVPTWYGVIGINRDAHGSGVFFLWWRWRSLASLES
jgi:hypothetical protein